MAAVKLPGPVPEVTVTTRSVARASGDAQRFDQVYEQYNKAKDITAERAQSAPTPASDTDAGGRLGFLRY